MYRKVLLIGVLIIIVQFAQAQFKGGLYFGVNGTQVDGDKLAGFYKLGANLAAAVEYPIGEHMGIGMEISFSQKGSQTKWQQGIPRQYFLKLDYIEVPLMLNYHDNKKVTLSAGVGINALTNFKEEIVNFNPYLTYSHIRKLNKSDVEFKAGGSYQLNKHWMINILYSYSIISMGISDDSPYLNNGLFNNLVTFRLGYMIKGKANK